MPPKCLNFDREEDVNEFLDALNEFSFQVYHVIVSKTILIKGKVDYAGCDSDGKFKIIIYDDDRKLTFTSTDYYNIISLTAPNKEKEFIVLKSVRAEFRSSELALEY